MKNDIITRVNEVMVERGLTREQVAKMSNVSLGTANKILGRFVERPTKGKIESICEALNLHYNKDIIAEYGYIVASYPVEKQTLLNQALQNAAKKDIPIETIIEAINSL